jgi:phosphoglycolate phosphatase-like HAD superfamily hydrolase
VIRGVLLDIDGTLIDSNDARVRDVGELCSRLDELLGPGA